MIDGIVQIRACYGTNFPQKNREERERREREESERMCRYNTYVHMYVQMYVFVVIVGTPSKFFVFSLVKFSSDPLRRNSLLEQTQSKILNVSTSKRSALTLSYILFSFDSPITF